jgi:hypothetical protein
MPTFSVFNWISLFFQFFPIPHYPYFNFTYQLDALFSPFFMPMYQANIKKSQKCLLGTLLVNGLELTSFALGCLSHICMMLVAFEVISYLGYLN